MDGNENALMTDAVCDLIMGELSETMDSCHTCVLQVGEFMKVANCILSKDEYYDFLGLYKQFDSNLVILENLSEQIDEPLNLLQAVSLKATMKELKREFEDIVLVLELANERIDDGDVDLNMAKLIQRILKLESFDAINYEDLEDAMEKTFIILQVVDTIDDNHDGMYYPFSYLKITSFDDKIAAYGYAIKNGIAKDQILNRYGAQLTP